MSKESSIRPPSGPDADPLRAALEESARLRERMELLSSASFEGMVFHVDGVVFDVNQRLTEISGYERHELLGDQLLKRCVAPEDLPDLYRRMVSGSEGEYFVTGVRKDGTRFRAELQAKQGKLGDRPVRVVAVRDVTERERSQELLRESEARLRELAASTFDLTVFSRDGVILDVVGPLESLLGYQREQFIGHRLLSFVGGGVAAREIIAVGRAGVFESVAMSAGGEAIPMEVVAVQTTLHGQPVRMSALRDLRTQKRLERERRELERAFEQSQRLDSLGVLAGGIAHDFNNLLTVVLGGATLLSAKLAGRAEQELVQAIIDAGQRAATLTSQMLAYAGRNELGPRTPVDLGALARELRTLLDATLSKKAQVTLSITEGTLVLGNRATLTQVLMNLLTNASDALSDEPGRIDVRITRVEEPDARFQRALGAKVGPGRWALVDVSDTGIGMDEATRTRIFEPFFTTKPKGHGLGLAACIGIVSSHGGAILVESQRGHGATFSVLLPAHEGASPLAPERSSRRSSAARRVLVVDDEPLLRVHMRQAFESQGHEVVEADSGNAALEAFARTEPSVVVLDVTLPDISGVEVLRRIRDGGSRVPVILSSGYHDVALDIDRDSFQAFLAKPYTLAELLEAVEGALGS